MFLLNINSTPSPPTSGWATISPLLGFLLKEDTSSYRGEPTGILAARILSFIEDKGKLTNIGNSC